MLNHPRRLFLLDGIGALISAVLLTQLPGLGLPAATIRTLAGLASVCAAYSLTCAQFVTLGNYRPYLAAVALANTGYCVVTLGTLVRHRASVTPLGVTYLLLEILVISLLVCLEFRAVRGSSG